MKCPECKESKTKKQMHEMEVRVAGNVLNVCVCGDCKTNFEKIMSFASAFPKAGAPAAKARAAQTPRTSRARRPDAPPAPKKNLTFDRYALSEEEIARTQALRPTVRIPDTPRKRQIDDIDKINTGERVRVYCMAASPKMNASREKKILSKAQSELGTIDVRKVKDNGFEAVFEAAGRGMQ